MRNHSTYWVALALWLASCRSHSPRVDVDVRGFNDPGSVRLLVGDGWLDASSPALSSAAAILLAESGRPLGAFIDTNGDGRLDPDREPSTQCTRAGAQTTCRFRRIEVRTVRQWLVSGRIDEGSGEVTLTATAPAPEDGDVTVAQASVNIHDLASPSSPVRVCWQDRATCASASGVASETMATLKLCGLTGDRARLQVDALGDRHEIVVPVASKSSVRIDGSRQRLGMFQMLINVPGGVDQVHALVSVAGRETWDSIGARSILIRGEEAHLLIPMSVLTRGATVSIDVLDATESGWDDMLLQQTAAHTRVELLVGLDEQIAKE